MDFIHIAQFLSRLPDDLQSHTLFAAMANTQMVSRNRRWVQVGVRLQGGAAFFFLTPHLLPGVFCTHEERKQRDGEEREPSFQKLTLAGVGQVTQAAAGCGARCCGRRRWWRPWSVSQILSRCDVIFPAVQREKVTPPPRRDQNSGANPLISNPFSAQVCCWLSPEFCLPLALALAFPVSPQ